MDTKRTPEGWRLIQGGRSAEIRFGRVLIKPGAGDEPPFKVDGVVVEEDTFLILNAPREVREPEESLIRIMTRLINAPSPEPGTVLFRQGRPHRLIAIVYDVDKDPIWREEWIEKALRGVFREVGIRGFRSLGLPLLGTHHGGLTITRFLELFAGVLKEAGDSSLNRIWLRVPADRKALVMKTLRSLLPRFSGHEQG